MLDRAKIEEIVRTLYFATGAELFFEPPEVGVADAADPFFQRFKTIIGDFHWTPEEVVPGARSVICWALPIQKDARETNRPETARPSVLWARSRSYGELANEEMRTQLCRHLEAAGYAAAAPHLVQMKKGLKVFEEYTSCFSERHASFVAGLGTFGLSAGLIGRRGVAARYGVVVTTLELPPDKRAYGDDPFAWCSRCGACIRRCPAGAIGKEIADRDKKGCADYQLAHVVPNRLQNYGWETWNLGCGLCQTAVPCEHQIPL